MQSRIHRLYLKETALVKLLDHIHGASHNQKELMGFMLGTAAQWKGSRFVVIETVVTTDLDVEDPRKWKEEGLDLDDIKSRLEQVVGEDELVGWYHSHPARQIKIKRDDVMLHNRIFKKGGGIALIVDPIEMDMRAFAIRKSGMPQEVSYAVF